MSDIQLNNSIWVEKYRPQTIEDAILPQSIKDVVKQFIKQDHMPNLLFTGRAGVGKTTVAKAIMKEIGADYIIINGSMKNGIDTLRVEILNFASTVSFAGGIKYVILDEADYLSAATQAALRNFMEEFADNCRFILTCNFKNKIIEPIHSRCSVVDFKIPKEDKQKIAAAFYKRACDILKKEGVEFKPKAVAELIQIHFPDWRRVLNELQRYAASGIIDEGILIGSSSEAAVERLFTLMKEKNFTEVRKWVVENGDIDSSALYRAIYDMLPSKLASTTSIAESIITLAQYQYQEAFVAIPEINRVAALATLMVEADFK
jgi:DNA polymerase III delta prime subunit